MNSQDNGAPVSRSRRLAAARFDVTWEQVLAIEREGMINNWPPLPPGRALTAVNPDALSSVHVQKLSSSRGKKMQKRFQARLAALGKGVQAAPMSEGCRRTAAWCIGQLPSLYTKFQQTNESRYGDEITRVVKALLNELADSEGTCPGARQLADQITDKFRLLHETFGLPQLHIALLTATTSRPPKIR